MMNMKMLCIILFMLPILTNAEIAINVTVQSNKNEVIIKLSGNHYKQVTNVDLDMFNVTTDKLNKGMRVELGKVPNDIFLQDPTRLGNIFEQYHWEPVKISLKVHKASIIDIANEDVVLETHEHINNTTLVLESKRHIEVEVENLAKSLRFEGGLPGDDVFYDIDFNLTYGHFNYRNKWNSYKTHFSKMPIEVNKKGNIFIEPFETVVTKLTATKTILVIELEYKAKLIGAAVANYATVYGKYHYWAPSIQSIMKAAGMKNEITIREQIEIECYINPRIHVYDKLTGKAMEPPKKKRPTVRILKNKKKKRVLYTRVKKQEKKTEEYK